MRKPKNVNRILLLNLGTSEAPEFKPFVHGLSSWGNSFSEDSEKYYDWYHKGVAETEVKSQDIVRSFNGHRVAGDEVQDYIFEELLYDISRREVEYIDYYNDIDVSGSNPPPNGWKGKGTIQITDDGSGDATSRQNIGFNLSLNGIPERGTVTLDPTTSKYIWTKKV